MFENPKHDFPNKIIYKKITSDSIFAQIFGNENGVKKFENFPMKRVK